jgi:hypothetical protein
MVKDKWDDTYSVKVTHKALIQVVWGEAGV